MKYKDEVFKIIKSKTNKQCDQNTVIRELGLDSIDLIEMVVEFEEQFNVSIPTEKIKDIKTVGDILSVLDSLF